MTRRLFTLVSAVSLLLCVATCVLWVRASWTEDDFDLGGIGGDADWWASSSGGELALIRQAGDDFGEPLPGVRLPGFCYLASASATGSHRQYAASYWVLASLFGVVPAAWAWRVRRGRIRRRNALAGLCPTCGYDLRASPGRCPECGAAVTEVRERAANGYIGSGPPTPGRRFGGRS
jgi:hypothetical protein